MRKEEIVEKMNILGAFLVQRLSDNEDGYGSEGKGYIVHVDIPNEVEKAFMDLKKEFGDKVRVANPEYAGQNKLIETNYKKWLPLI